MSIFLTNWTTSELLVRFHNSSVFTRFQPVRKSACFARFSITRAHRGIKSIPPNLHLTTRPLSSDNPLNLRAGVSAIEIFAFWDNASKFLILEWTKKRIMKNLASRTCSRSCYTHTHTHTPKSRSSFWNSQKENTTSSQEQRIWFHLYPSPYLGMISVLMTKSSSSTSLSAMTMAMMLVMSLVVGYAQGMSY